MAEVSNEIIGNMLFASNNSNAIFSSAAAFTLKTELQLMLYVNAINSILYMFAAAKDCLEIGFFSTRRELMRDCKYSQCNIMVYIY